MENRDAKEGSSLRDELRDDTGRVTHAAAERLQSEADSRKGQVADQARAVSSALGNAADELGADTPTWVKSALEQGAKSIEKLAHAVEGKDSRQLVEDVQQFARQRPGSFLAGCALLGFAASRVFKAGGTQEQASSTLPDTGPGTLESGASYPPAGTASARSAMIFTDGGGAATPVTSPTVGTSL